MSLNSNIRHFIEGAFQMDGHFSATPFMDVASQDDDMDTYEQVRRDAALDEALRCTFPASDPVALNFAFSAMADQEQHRLTIDFFKHTSRRNHPFS